MIIENRGCSKKAAISPAIQFPLFAPLNVDLPARNSLSPGYIVSSIGKPLPSPNIKPRTSITVVIRTKVTKPISIQTKISKTIQNK